TLQCTDCDPTCDADGVSTPNGACTFKLRVCANDAAGTCAATALKKVTVKGGCHAATLAFSPSGTAMSCGPEGTLTVKLKKHQKKLGKCKFTAKATSVAKPRRVDKDVLTLVCNPRPT